MKHARIIDPRFGEPVFDLPPRFSGVHDRRLGARIAAEWDGQWSTEALPAGTLRDAVDAGGANLVWIGCRDDVVDIHAVGESVAATFGLQPGLLQVDGAFARALGAAVFRSRADAAPAHFEGGYGRNQGDPATLLTRGTVVPLAGAAPAATACAVLTWTEMLAPADSDRLRRDLLSALAVPRSSVRSIPVSAIW